ncbi:MAG: polysaccharide deacetylase family protein [Saprospiraceae bacterium]|nr:polysaccharide deacetylase family protein [Saprospiraceae bacterium]
MKINLISLASMLLLFACNGDQDKKMSSTIITKWQDDKKAGISLTYDDGTIHQFTVARPIMDSLDFKATFYIITGKIKGSAQGKFIGRPVAAIIEETATVPTDSNNFFERASAIGFTGSHSALAYHSDAGALFESGKITEAYAKIDEGYAKLRSGEIAVSAYQAQYSKTDTTTWEDYKSYADDGHEIASHTVTHPRLAVLDEVNMLYELQQSRQDIIKFLGEEYTFSAECPYGTENERVMEYAHGIYPALRNRMPESWLEELNRSSKIQPGSSEKEYVQWQRGPLTNITMETMKAWVDTCLAHDNIWLVLVFHGVDSIGWEPRTGAELKEYFSYMKAREDDLWVATFADITKYLRERNNVSVTNQWTDDHVKIQMVSSLDTSIYNIPLTLKTYIPDGWRDVEVKQGNLLLDKEVKKDDTGKYVLFNLAPGNTEIDIRVI